MTLVVVSHNKYCREDVRRYNAHCICSPGSGKCAHIVCGVSKNLMTWGNNISVKRLGTSLDRYIERYINKQIIIFIIICQSVLSAVTVVRISSR